MTQISSFCWVIATFLLISCGLFYTFKLKFIQLNFKKMFKSLKKEDKNSNVSPIKTLTLALAARIGVGSLAGIALGIYKGGIGVIFWIWLSSFITIPNSFVESTLAVIYHEKDNDYYKGGPAYYISKGLKYKKLAYLYSIIITICYLGGFLAIQANTISISVNNYLNISNIITGVSISIISYIIISRGLKRIMNFTALLVPIMGILYFLITIIIIILNINKVPDIFISIFKEAFNIKALGWGIISSIIIGVQRGIFSSESGIGTGAVASGISDTKYPTKQGYIQMFGVYFTSFIICTSTALIILTSSVNMNDFINPNGIEITLKALNLHLGNFGTIILLFAVISFAFSTIISGYYYGESNLSFIDKKMNFKKRKILNIIIVIILFVGSIIKPSSLWNMVDIGVSLLAIINSVSIILLNKDIMYELKKEGSS